MKRFNIVWMFILVIAFTFGFSGQTVFAATTPSLGSATTYGILGSTYTNTSAGTTVNGDVGFTTGPAVAPLGTHTNYGSSAPYATAGTDQGSALSALAGEACTFTFAAGAINLSTDTTHGPIGVYAPGVYCSSGAMDIGGPLNLNGSGTYIFRPVGAFTTTAGATITLSGASACDVFWTPSSATTLAANTTFVGTVIGNAGVTVGANTAWTGRSLAFGGTVTTDTTTITVPTCTAPPAYPTPYSTPYATPYSTPYATPYPTPISTATTTPYATPYATPYSTTTPPVVVAVVTPVIPTLPETGFPPREVNAPWNIIIPSGILVALFSFYLARKKQII